MFKKEAKMLYSDMEATKKSRPFLIISSIIDLQSYNVNKKIISINRVVKTTLLSRFKNIDMS